MHPTYENSDPEHFVLSLPVHFDVDRSMTRCPCDLEAEGNNSDDKLAFLKRYIVQGSRLFKTMD